MNSNRHTVGQNKCYELKFKDIFYMNSCINVNDNDKKII